MGEQRMCRGQSPGRDPTGCVGTCLHYKGALCAFVHANGLKESYCAWFGVTVVPCSKRVAKGLPMGGVWWCSLVPPARLLALGTHYLWFGVVVVVACRKGLRRGARSARAPADVRRRRRVV